MTKRHIAPGLLLSARPAPPQPEFLVLHRILAAAQCASIESELGGAAMERSDKALDKRSESVPLDKRRWQWLYKVIARTVIDNNPWRLRLSGFTDPALLQRYRKRGYSGLHNDVDFLTSDYAKITVVIPIVPRAHWAGGDLRVGASLRAVPFQRGDAVLFPSYLMHEVTPVTSGCRVALTAWISGPPLV